MKRKKPKTPPPSRASQAYEWGKNPDADAWYTAFFLENHLDYYAYPDHVATPEQVRFIVYTEDNDRYYPCSDQMFWTIMSREKPQELMEKYEKVLGKRHFSRLSLRPNTSTRPGMLSWSLLD